jgi:CheY-like chemotaxis protein
VRDLKRKTILIIDDDPVSRLVLKKILEGAGYNVAEAESADQGLTKTAEIVPHAILCDIRMPGKSGIDFLLDKGRNLRIQSIPTMMVSGVTDKETVFQASAYGAIDYIYKPVETRVLIQKLNKVFQSSEYLVRHFDSTSSSKIQVRIHGSISGCTRGGFTFDSNVRMSENAIVQVQSPILKEVGVDECIQKRSERPARLGESGLFSNEILLVGITPKMIQAFRSKIKGW